MTENIVDQPGRRLQVSRSVSDVFEDGPGKSAGKKCRSRMRSWCVNLKPTLSSDDVVRIGESGMVAQVPSVTALHLDPGGGGYDSWRE